MRYRNWNMKFSKVYAAAAAIVLLILPASALAQGENTKDLGTLHARMSEEIRHELVMLPYYTIFDNLVFEIQDVDTVVLSGQVTHPVLKADAEKVVKRIESVGKVVNNIEVLPLSPLDNRIRIAAYRAIYFRPGLNRYALQAAPSIHIIVKGGHITLAGTVGTEMDKTLAEIAAKGVSGSFSVTNNLRANG